MDTPEKILLVVFIVLLFPLLFGIFYVSYYYQPDIKPIVINTKPIPKKVVKEEPVVIEPAVDNIKTIETPEIIKAVYITASSAKSQQYLKYLDNLLETTEINAVVIDIKDYSGQVAISAFDSLIQKLHDKGIYVIARMVIFEDASLAKARPDLAIYDKSGVGNNNLSWIDPASKEAWDYNILIAKDVVAHGFDELNFDYIRFPSDGKIEDMGFPFWDKKVSMRSVIKEFFQKLRESLPNVKLSVDLFGYSTVSVDDMGIGQVLEDSFDYFDYISPMIYPSHYKEGFIGYSNPAQYPYEVVKYSMQEALKKQASSKVKFRPWLQDFNMGADYTIEMVKEEIQAVSDVLGENFYGFMLWNASNVYTTDAIK